MDRVHVIMGYSYLALELFSILPQDIAYLVGVNVHHFSLPSYRQRSNKVQEKNRSNAPIFLISHNRDRHFKEGTAGTYKQQRMSLEIQHSLLGQSTGGKGDELNVEVFVCPAAKRGASSIASPTNSLREIHKDSFRS